MTDKQKKLVKILNDLLKDKRLTYEDYFDFLEALMDEKVIQQYPYWYPYYPTFWDQETTDPLKFNITCGTNVTTCGDGEPTTITAKDYSDCTTWTNYTTETNTDNLGQ